MTRFGKSHGFGLVEFILALTLGALAMAGVWVVFEERSEIVRAQVAVHAVKKILDDVDRLTSNLSTVQIKQMSGGAPVGLTMTRYAQYINAIPMGAAFNWAGADSMPEGVSVSESGGSYFFRNAWGGDWSLATGSTGTLTLDLAVVTMTKVPSMACTTILSDLSPQLYDTHVNGTLVGLAPARTATSLGRTELRVSQAIPLCANEENTVVMRRMKDYRMAQMRWGPVALPTVNANEGNRFTGLDANGTPQYQVTGANVLSNYTRIQTAYTNLESAQAALP